MRDIENLQFNFNIGDIVTHVISPLGAVTLLVLDRSYTEGSGGASKRYFCRVLVDHAISADWFHEHELRRWTLPEAGHTSLANT